MADILFFYVMDRQHVVHIKEAASLNAAKEDWNKLYDIYPEMVLEAPVCSHKRYRPPNIPAYLEFRIAKQWHVCPLCKPLTASMEATRLAAIKPPDETKYSSFLNH
jgi:hypothetical protein